MSKTIHIVGAGVAGLATAVSAIQAGHTVRVYETTKRAGGRCRSFFDPTLDTILDNGSHVVLGGNPNVARYLRIIGADDSLIPVSQNGKVAFFDVSTDQRWTIQPNPGSIPWWILFAKKRPPKTGSFDFAAGLKLLYTRGNRSVADVLGENNKAWSPFWHPLALAVMNTDPAGACAGLFGAAVKRALLSGNSGFAPFVPKDTLAATFIQPAENFLNKTDCPILFESPLLKIEGGVKAKTLHFRTHTVTLNDQDAVVLALPPWSPPVQRFQPQSFTPLPSPIVNVHFAIPDEINSIESRMMGLINSNSHWIFLRPGVVSVTVSADSVLAKLKHDEIASLLWRDVEKALKLSPRPAPANRVIVERRATPIQDAAFNRNRPATRTALDNLFLAGDWIDTGLPCTLEGAVTSGFRASEAAIMTSGHDI